MNWALSEKFVEQAIDNVLLNQKCKDLHQNSCNHYASLSAFSAMKSCRNLYFFVHLIPLLLKYKKLKKNPQEVLTKFIVGYVKSMLFVGGSLFMIRRVVCLVTQLYQFSTVGILLSGLASGLPLLIESPGRQAEISIFCLKEGLSMVYLILRRRYEWLHIDNGQMLVFGLSMAIILYQFFQSKESRENFRESYKKVLGFAFNNI